MTIISISLCFAIPSLTSRLGTEHAKSTANALSDFILEAKFISATRNLVLWILIDEGDIEEGREWTLTLTPSSDKTDDNYQELRVLKGEGNVSLHSGYMHDRIYIEGVKGKVGSGYLQLSSDQPGIPILKVVTSYGAGRVRVCAVEESIDGFPQC
jgi:type IV fimbrial biogenesis protein FimT